MKINDHETHAAMYNDMTSLQNIKANGDKMEALEQAAGQFEAVFLQTVLKNMRQASDAMHDDEDDSVFNSRQQKFYRSMHDSQIAMEMSQQQSLGIADMLVKQLGQHEAFKPKHQTVAMVQQGQEIAPGSVSPLPSDAELNYSQVERPQWWRGVTPLSQQMNLHLDDEEL
ncbi:flagellar biosynthesis [Photobacterium marinum]|uniref:Flagellar biosynthesis n=1 Tax=Photobacterium marinum TaxID=1056511 RepID=L8JHS7_9GAMM|nr:rod-binding protein [Photobacterium marinum]ELR67079.1 flagellar biosynthesis [Photobacterium marinum]